MRFWIFPFLSSLTTLLSFLGLPKFSEWLRQQVPHLLPVQGMEQVNAVLLKLQASSGDLIGVVCLRGIVGTMNALNVAYDVKVRPPV